MPRRAGRPPSGPGRPVQQDPIDAADVETNDQAPGFNHLRVERVLLEVVVEGRMDLQELPGREPPAQIPGTLVSRVALPTR
jgi:hypothetical protein